MSRVTSDLPMSGTQPYFDRRVHWDDQSRVSSIDDLANAAMNASYGYDALDRLTSSTQGTSSWGYSYNGIGDRLSATVGAASTTYGYAPGTHRLQALSGAQVKSFGYDAAGNTTSDGTTTWTIGGNNRPTQAGTATFAINALGQRVKKSSGSAVTRFVYDEAGRLWDEYGDDGSLVQETVWLEDLPVATLRPNGTGVDIYYVHPDHLGTPRMVTRSSDNQIVWRWDSTEPFGNSQPDENPGGLGAFAYNLRFPGQYYDSETGKHYNYYRDYDPAIGRYIESDPIGLKGGLNTYGYAKGDPLRLTDPTGQFSAGFYGVVIGLIAYGGYEMWSHYAELVECKKKCKEKFQCPTNAGNTGPQHACDGECVLRFWGGSSKTHKGGPMGPTPHDPIP